jgi:beta-lactamase regulating signal transducer with metallopeptidase domain
MTAWVGAEIAGSVANGIVEGLALSMLLWLLLRLTPRAAAATRYALCGLALAFIAVLPAAQGWLPRLGATASGGAILTLTAGSWLIWVLGAWALGSLILMARVAWGLVALGSLKRGASAAPAEVAERFEGIMRACPGSRRARVLVSDDGAGPIAAGILKPAVVLPAFLVEELSDAELDQVLTHELAHIRRWDDWTNLAQKVVEALLFFHPAVIWIGRRLTLEREIACDDWVVGLAGTARPYATCLTRLAAIHRATPQLAPGALARRPQLSIRVEALLEGGRDRRRRSSRSALTAAAATLAVTAFAAAPWAPVTVALPAVPVVAARAMTPVVTVAARPAVPVAVARLRRARPQRDRLVARSVAPHAAVEAGTAQLVETADGSVAPLAAAAGSDAPLATVMARSGGPVPGSRAPLGAAPAPAMILYVVYVDGGDAGWIRILWVHQIPPQAVNRT